MILPDGVRAWCGANGWTNVRAQRLTGGAVNTVVRIAGADGRTVVAKTTDGAPDGMFAAEADGLRQLDRTATIAVPRVVDVGADHLILQDLGPTDLRRLDWAELGRRIAALHRVASARFGAEHDNFLGVLPQRNEWTDDGHEFFARHRLLRYLGEPPAMAALTASDRRGLQRLADRLPALVPAQPASLLHGDLWSGNVLGNATTVAVADPAVYFGWPEAELSMLWCSGGYDQRFFDAYLDEHPLEPGWQERMPLLHLREHLSVLAHFGATADALTGVRDVLRRFT